MTEQERGQSFATWLQERINAYAYFSGAVSAVTEMLEATSISQAYAIELIKEAKIVLDAKLKKSMEK